MVIKFTHIHTESNFKVLIRNIKTNTEIRNKEAIIEWLERNKKRINSNNYVIMCGNNNSIHSGDFVNSIDNVKSFFRHRQYYKIRLLYKKGIRDRSLE